MIVLCCSACVRCADAQAAFTPPLSQERCACAARQSGWTINCADPGGSILTAAKYLQDNAAACSAPSTSTSTSTTTTTCAQSYAILQTHRDHCAYGSLPKSADVDVRAMLDKYAAVYDACYIPRHFDATAAACPSVNCADADALIEAVHTLYVECSVTCGGDRCKSAFWSLLAARDVCPKASLLSTVGTALHDFEEHCAASACNSERAPYDPDAVNCAELAAQRLRAIDEEDAQRKKEEHKKAQTVVIVVGVSVAVVAASAAALVVAAVMRSRSRAAAYVVSTNTLADNRAFDQLP